MAKTFKKGMKVTSTKQAQQWGVAALGTEGVVTSVFNMPHAMRVRVGNRKTADTFHPDFWRPVTHVAVED